MSPFRILGWVLVIVIFALLGGFMGDFHSRPITTILLLGIVHVRGTITSWWSPGAGWAIGIIVQLFVVFVLLSMFLWFYKKSRKIIGGFRGKS